MRRGHTPLPLLFPPQKSDLRSPEHSLTFRPRSVFPAAHARGPGSPARGAGHSSRWSPGPPPPDTLLDTQAPECEMAWGPWPCHARCSQNRTRMSPWPPLLPRPAPWGHQACPRHVPVAPADQSVLCAAPRTPSLSRSFGGSGAGPLRSDHGVRVTRMRTRSPGPPVTRAAAKCL